MLLCWVSVAQGQQCKASATGQEPLITKGSAEEGGEGKHPI